MRMVVLPMPRRLLRRGLSQLSLHGRGDGVSHFCGACLPTEVAGQVLAPGDHRLDRRLDTIGGGARLRLVALSAEPGQQHLAPPYSGGGGGGVGCRDVRRRAEPWVACAFACRSPTHSPGAKPSPPTRPAPMSVRMSPNWLVVTTTSNCCGAVTGFIESESIIISSKLTSAY